MHDVAHRDVRCQLRHEVVEGGLEVRCRVDQGQAGHGWSRISLFFLFLTLFTVARQKASAANGFRNVHTDGSSAGNLTP